MVREWREMVNGLIANPYAIFWVVLVTLCVISAIVIFSQKKPLSFLVRIVNPKPKENVLLVKKVKVLIYGESYGAGFRAGVVYGARAECVAGCGGAGCGAGCGGA